MERKGAFRPTIAMCVLILALVATGTAVEFAGGTGEPNAPYQIVTAEQLTSMADDPNLYDRHFVLVADIDLDPALPGGKVFRQPVLHWEHLWSRSGYNDRPFEGHFDGGGHTIRNGMLYHVIDSPHAGLFRSIGPQGTVCNLNLENVFVADGSGNASHYGALAGENAGYVVDCTATGTILADSVGVSATLPFPLESPYQCLPSAGLIGKNLGTIVGCHAHTHVFGMQVAGLAGINTVEGRIVSCSSTGMIVGNPSAGGLAYSNAGVIQYCFAMGSVLANQAGGLVMENSGTVRESFASARVSGGGLIGENYGTVLNGYTTGAIQGDGLTEANHGTIASSYSTTPALIPAPSTRRRSIRSEGAGAMALASASDRVRYVYYLDPNKPENQADYSHLFEGGVPLSPLEMERQTNFVGFDFRGDANDGAGDHWFMPASGYPVLTWQTEITGLAGVPDTSDLTPEQARELLTFAGFTPGAVSHDYARYGASCNPRCCILYSTEGRVIHCTPRHYAAPGDSVSLVVSLGPYNFEENPGDGSAANPYQIETPGQLDSLYDQDDLWASHFVLTTDLDLTYREYSRSLIRRFSGTFDGKGHSIRYNGQNGLFGTIEPNGVVCDLVLERVRIDAGSQSDQVGMLAGWNQGEIRHCAVSGRILGGRSNVGGLVGDNAGQLLNCRVRGLIRGGDEAKNIGGLAGHNTKSIMGCCAVETTIVGHDYVGGLVGLNHDEHARIEASYTQGTVHGKDRVGGLVGANIHGLSIRNAARLMMADDPVAVIEDCYAACQTTGQSKVGGCIGYAASSTLQEDCYFLDPNDGGGPDNGHGTALSLDAMRQRASFVGWDFETVWTICEGQGFPRLSWEGLTCAE